MSSLSNPSATGWTGDLLERTCTGRDDRPIDIDNRVLPTIDLDRPIPAIPINQTRTLLSQRPRKVRKDARGKTVTHGDTRIGLGGIIKMEIRRNTTPQRLNTVPLL
jgi:hypothetical protein